MLWLEGRAGTDRQPSGFCCCGAVLFGVSLVGPFAIVPFAEASGPLLPLSLLSGSAVGDQVLLPGPAARWDALCEELQLRSLIL